MSREEMIALVNRQAVAWQTRDAHAISADFATDGVLIAPSGRLTGPDAIREEAESVFASTTAIKITIKRVLIDGDAGAVEWTWTETSARNGQQKTMDDAIIFAVQDGKIVYWREYIVSHAD
jgi:uncharacterized protein (TIGR02246 family)